MNKIVWAPKAIDALEQRYKYTSRDSEKVWKSDNIKNFCNG